METTNEDWKLVIELPWLEKVRSRERSITNRWYLAHVAQIEGRIVTRRNHSHTYEATNLKSV